MPREHGPSSSSSLSSFLTSLFSSSVGAAATEDTAAGHITGDVTGLTGRRSTATTTSSSGSFLPPDGPDVVLDVLLQVGVLVPVVVQLGALQDRQAVQRGDGQEPHVFVKAYRRRCGGGASSSLLSRFVSIGLGAEGRPAGNRSYQNRRSSGRRTSASAAAGSALGVVSQISHRDRPLLLLPLLFVVLVVGTGVVAPPPCVVGLVGAVSPPAAAEHAPQDVGRQLRPPPPPRAAIVHTDRIGRGCRPHLSGVIAQFSGTIVVLVTVTAAFLGEVAAAAVGAITAFGAMTPFRREGRQVQNLRGRSP